MEVMGNKYKKYTNDSFFLYKQTNIFISLSLVKIEPTNEVQSRPGFFR